MQWILLPNGPADGCCLLAFLVLLGFLAFANIPTVANVPAVAGDPALSFMLLRKSNLLNYQTIGLILILLLDHRISVYPLCWTIILGYQLL